MAEHEPEHRCKASNARGEPCKATIVRPDGFCPAHAGGGRDMRALGKLGGRARGRKQPEQASERLEGLAHAAIEELLQSSGSATARAAAARLVLDKLAANSAYSVELAKKAASAEMQARMDAEAPAVREKVGRLIESRARAKADAMTEADLEPLIERRARELAEEMYAERMRLETEAVKAELTDSTALPATDETETQPPPVDVETQIEETRREAERERLARKFGPPPES